MVRPIILYCSDFWGCLNPPKNNPIEKLYLRFCKQLLGVRKQTNTTGVLLELGMIPITIHSIKASTKNWERICKQNCSKLLTAAYSEAKSTNLPWIDSIKSIFNTNGLLNTFISTTEQRDNKERPSSLVLFQRLCDQFHQTAFNNIKDSSRLRFYSILKKDIGRENYLTDITNFKHRQALTKLRLSAHSLEIETGRHKNKNKKDKTKREDRICPLCKVGIEDETHFLIKCPVYNEARMKHIQPLLNLHDIAVDQAKHVMMQDDLKPTAKFIYEAFTLRETSVVVQNTFTDIVSTIEKVEDSIHKQTTKAVEGTIKHIISTIESTEKKPNTFYIKGYFDSLKVILCRGPYTSK